LNAETLMIDVGARILSEIPTDSIIALRAMFRDDVVQSAHI
jgi:hypothetical protein